MDEIFANRANFTDLSSASPRALLAMHEASGKHDGTLGSVMVMSIELPEGDNRPPRDALKEVRRPLSIRYWLSESVFIFSNHR